MSSHSNLGANLIQCNVEILNRKMRTEIKRMNLFFRMISTDMSWEKFLYWFFLHKLSCDNNINVFILITYLVRRNGTRLYKDILVYSIVPIQTRRIFFHYQNNLLPSCILLDYIYLLEKIYLVEKNHDASFAVIKFQC